MSYFNTKPSTLFVTVFSAIGGAFLLFNLKRNFAEPAWNNFFVFMIFFLNIVELPKQIKIWRTKKDNIPE